MSFSINYPEDKINVIFSILLQHKIVVIVLRPPAACRRFSPDQGDRRLAAKSVIVSVILISALCAPYTSRFSNPAASGESKRIILKVFLSVPALQTSFTSGCVYD